MTFSKIVLSLLALGILVSCSTESQKKKDFYLGQACRYKRDGNFCVDKVRLSSAPVAGANSYGISNKKFLNFETCIKDQLNGSVEAGLEFVVIGSSGEEIPVITDGGGCVRWQETHVYSHFTDEGWFKIRRILKSKTYYQGQVLLEYGFNPWDGSIVDTTTDKVPEDVELEDLGQVSVRGQKLISQKPSNAKFNLTSASFKFVGQVYDQYEVTPLLDLIAAHEYEARITPMVMRKTLRRSFVAEQFTTGSMRVVLVIFKDDRENPSQQFSLKNAIASTEFEGPIVQGTLATSFVIKFPNAAALMSRTRALLTLVPTEELEGLPTMSFTGVLSPGNLSSLDLKPTNVNALQMHQEFQAKLSSQRAKSKKALNILAELKDQFKVLDLSPVSVQSPDLFRVQPRYVDLQGHLKNFLSKERSHLSLSANREFLLALCEKVYGTHADLAPYKTTCKMAPEAMLQLDRRTFVEKLNSTHPEYIKFSTTKDSLNLYTTYAVGKVSSLSAGWNWKLGFSLGGGWSQDAKDINPYSASMGLKFSAGADLGYAQVFKRDESSGASMTRSRAVDVEGNSFKIKAKTRSCITVQPSLNWQKAIRNGKPAGVYYCLSEVRDEERTETYYLINSKDGIDGSPLSDNAAANNWRMIIRGPQMMNFFMKLADQPAAQLVLGLVDEKAAQGHLEDFNNQNETFPGQLSENLD